MTSASQARGSTPFSLAEPIRPYTKAALFRQRPLQVVEKAVLTENRLGIPACQKLVQKSAEPGCARTQADRDQPADRGERSADG
jgi:hypothetical protein